MAVQSKFHACQPVSTLYALPQVAIENGYTLNQAFYTAMSMDYDYWKTLLTLQAGKKVKLDFLLCRELERTWFMTESMSGARKDYRSMESGVLGSLLSRVRYYYDEPEHYPAACFHAKMAFLRYTSEQQPDYDYFRIGVFSKNLTNDSEFQNICVLDGFAEKNITETNITDNGMRLWAYLTYCAEHAHALEKRSSKVSNDPFLQAIRSFLPIKTIRLPENCDVFFNGLQRDGIRQKDNDTCLWDVLKKDCDQGKLSVVTKSLFIEPSSSYVGWAARNGVSIYNCLQEDNGIYSDKTHMKLYWKNASDQPEYGEFWMGSANFSAPALGKHADGRLYRLTYSDKEDPPYGYTANVECLVRFRNMDLKKLGLLDVLRQTDPAHKIMEKAPPVQEEDHVRSESLQVLRDICCAYSFSYKKYGEKWDLVCKRRGDSKNETVKLKDSQVWPPTENNPKWYWTAVPQKLFRSESYIAARTESRRVKQADAVVVSVWNPSDPECPLDSLVCSRWVYVWPDGVELPDPAEEQVRQETVFADSVLHRPWIGKLLSAKTESVRNREFLRFHDAVVGLRASRYQDWEVRLNAVKEFEVLYRKRMIEQLLDEMGVLPEWLDSLQRVIALEDAGQRTAAWEHLGAVSEELAELWEELGC